MAERLFNRIPAGPGSPIQVPRAFPRLYDLSHNLWWTWNPKARDLWSRIDPVRWTDNRNPLSVMAGVEPETWEALQDNARFLDLYDEVLAQFDFYLSSQNTWYQRHHAPALDDGIAYLSAEFGVDHTLPFYSGGLGVLAGDHAKAASDLGLPLLGIGLFYRRGYFRQEVDHDGEQQHHYHHIEMTRRPVRPVIGTDGRPIRIEVDLPGRTIATAVWRIDVGRVPLLLLDTDVAENDPADRPISHILYVRGREMRLCQEVVLGIGAVRLLQALGLKPKVWHVNEGHAAFSLLERLSRYVEEGLAEEEALARIRANTLFTLHTPVPAGNEVFDPALVRYYLEDAIPGLEWSAMERLGRVDGDDGFNMSGLAIRSTSITNAVSQRHAEIATGDWHQLIGGPAIGITNGVHIPTWAGPRIHTVFERALGPDWPEALGDPDAWKAIHDVDDAEVWRAHVREKERMVRDLRRRIQAQRARHGFAPGRLRHVADQLPPERLTLVFARRFASYKRAGLLLMDPDRLTRLLTDSERPVQVIFAGKAHPADREGQGIIRGVVDLSLTDELGEHIFFIEDYNMELARMLVVGADVWLNTPRPPLEASGTSGMKAAANGGLNLSVLDGWWVEGWNRLNGWGFGADAATDDEAAAELYDLLEQDVIPLYYERDADGIPTGWVARMKESLATLVAPFSAHRMLLEYTGRAYVPLGSNEFL